MIKIRTYNEIAVAPSGTIEQAVALCNKLALANGSVYPPFKACESGKEIVMTSFSYANPDYTKGMYAVLFMVDHIKDPSIAYTNIYSGVANPPVRIVNGKRSTNWSLFIKEIKKL